jgi:hypothetical protein
MDQARKESILNVAEKRIELRKFAPEFATLPTQVGPRLAARREQ